MFASIGHHFLPALGMSASIGLYFLPALGITFCQHRACLPAFGHLSMSYVSMQTGIFRKPEYLGSHDILSVP
jgi:hypothetical protein